MKKKGEKGKKRANHADAKLFGLHPAGAGARLSVKRQSQSRPGRAFIARSVPKTASERRGGSCKFIFDAQKF